MALALAAKLAAITVEVRTQYLDAQEPTQWLGPAGLMRFFNNAQGKKLCSYYWPAAQQPKAVLVLSHGHGANIPYHFLKFNGVGAPKTYAGSWIEAFNAAGYSVCGMDLQGHGRSEGLFGYVNSFDDYVADTLQFASIVASTDVPGFAGLPQFILGVSLGGCIAVHAAMKEADRFQGVMLLAPMLSLEKTAKTGWNPYLRPIANVLNYLVPHLPLGSLNANVMFPDLQKDWDSDAATYHYPARVRSAVDYLRATEAFMARIHTVTFPFLAVHSRQDTMTDPDASVALFEKAQSKDKQLKLVDNMWHILTKEPGNEAILEHCIKWLDARVPQAESANGTL